ncbi:MAG: methionyl-tRNA formyltransferase [Candidatus Taylorbacteria bacterium]
MSQYTANESIKKASNFAYFGSSSFSVYVLDELIGLGIKPTLVITTPDKPQGRKLVLQPNVVKSWAIKNDVDFLDAGKLDPEFISRLKMKCEESGIDLFVVASYGKIIPHGILSIPEKGTLNIHPSLLPRYRGASPLPTAMLEDTKETGITIMKLDDQMDHGPIVAQEPVVIVEWPIYEVFEENMARIGAKLLAKTLPRWISGEIKSVDQNHAAATYTKKIQKEDAFIDSDVLNLDNITSEDQYTIYRKIQAYHEWPQAYFLVDKNGDKMRVKIVTASFVNGKLLILRVIPEGSKEMSFEDFKRGIKIILSSFPKAINP